jgi:hypothetical protein
MTDEERELIDGLCRSTTELIHKVLVKRVCLILDEVREIERASVKEASGRAMRYQKKIDERGY